MRPQNWVFLGDSLTEGIGSARTTFVSDFAAHLRQSGSGSRAIHLMRLREVDPGTFNPYIPTNLAGFIEAGSPDSDAALWIWNLASEGTTIASDQQWLPFLRNLRPERIFIYRGSLESIVRPAALRDGHWPSWVPRSWRGLVSMDPRCYFSSTWHRYAKQAAIDAIKQRARLRLLRDRPGQPHLDPDVILGHYRSLLGSLAEVTPSVVMLGLIGTDERCFPGTSAHFEALNARLRRLADEHRVTFIDWAADIDAARGEHAWRYRDGFHPNAAGAQLLGTILHRRLGGAP
ncbi:MAG: hypothetical protein RLZZ53_1751 [Acidobacteriota bacterium]